jgi:hypothetical protein
LRSVAIVIDEDRFDATTAPAKRHSRLADGPYVIGEVVELSLADEDRSVRAGRRLLVPVEVADQVGVSEARANK